MATKSITESVLSKLSDPMPPEQVKWRIQSFTKTNPKKAICIPYIDARQVHERLDNVVGVANWQLRHKEIKERVFAEIGIRIDGEWVFKSDVGAETKIEKEKGEVSDATKRAAVAWGIGRDLYSMQPILLECEGNTPVYKAGNKTHKLYNGDAISRACNYILKSKNAKQ